MGILAHQYEGDGLYVVDTTSGPFEVHLFDPFGTVAEVRKPDQNTSQHDGSMASCREWLEART
jgi:hypothetical protein